MKNIKKILPLFLVASMTLSSVTPAFAAGVASPKEEVIYIMTDANGTVKSGYAVNIFGSGDITDYGNYTDVKMLNTTDSITQNGDTITFSTSAGKTYYQGTLPDVEIPWNISIRYFLNGKEYKPEELAGQSGKLEISFKITQNKQYTGEYYDNFALQSTFTFDSDICDNLSTTDATIANVGSTKQITYTILPGKGIDTKITADVTNFEMDGVSINGVKLNMNIEIDDAQLMDKVNELIDATVKLNDGASSLNDGTAELKSGSSELKNGASDLKSGITTLDTGIVQLETGITNVQTGLNSLNAQSATLTNGSTEVKQALLTIQRNLTTVSASTEELTKLTEASGQIKQGINNLYAGITTLETNLGYAQYKAIMNQNGLDIDGLQAGNTQAISSLEAQITNIQTTLEQIQNAPGYEQQVAELQAQISQLKTVIHLLNGNNTAIGGTESYLNSLSAAVTELKNGALVLQTKYEEFDAAIAGLATKLGNMLVDISTLSDGINTIVDRYTTLDNGINAYTRGVAELVAGYNQIVDGISSLAEGSKELVDGSDTLYSGTTDLFDGIIELSDGSKELKDGTEELYNETSGMDTEIQDQIDELLATIGGDETETVSFVSEKNTNVTSLQFVIKTDAVTIPEIADVEVKEVEHLTFWQKLLQLFG